MQGELLTIYWALPAMRESGRYSLPLPNSLNFGFDYAFFCILTMLLGFLGISPDGRNIIRGTAHQRHSTSRDYNRMVRQQR